MTNKSGESIEAAQALEKVNSGALLIDVRTSQEFSEGHIVGAININSEEAALRLEEFGKEKEREVVLYCKMGGRAGRVAEILIAHGFTQVFNAGAYDDLKEIF